MALYVVKAVRGGRVDCGRSKPGARTRPELIREHVERGSLMIRKMTKGERRRHQHRPASPNGPGGR